MEQVMGRLQCRPACQLCCLTTGVKGLGCADPMPFCSSSGELAVRYSLAYPTLSNETAYCCFQSWFPIDVDVCIWELGSCSAESSKEATERTLLQWEW